MPNEAHGGTQVASCYEDGATTSLLTILEHTFNVAVRILCSSSWERSSSQVQGFVVLTVLATVPYTAMTLEER